MHPALALVAIVIVTILGDWCLKHASIRGGWLDNPYFLAGTGLYTLTGIGFVYAMRHLTLASIGVWYSMLTVLFMAGLGVVAFEERLTPREILGIVLAIAALALMLRTH